MTDDLRLLVGTAPSLAAYARVVPGLPVCRLTAGSSLLVVPLDADLHDRLHAAYGTGEWIEDVGLPLTTSDLAFAADASRAGPIAMLERLMPDDQSGQSELPAVETALLWQAGTLVLRPRSLSGLDRDRLAPAFWPINTVLRALGVPAIAGTDESDVFGFHRWTSSAAIMAAAPRQRIG